MMTTFKIYFIVIFGLLVIINLYIYACIYLENEIGKSIFYSDSKYSLNSKALDYNNSYERLLISLRNSCLQEDMAFVIQEVMPKHGNILIFGHFNPYFYKNTYGKIVFIESDSLLVKDRTIRNDFMSKYPLLEVYRINYKTKDDYLLSISEKQSDRWVELDLSDQIPATIMQTYWHVILVGSLHWCCKSWLENFQSLITSLQLTRNDTHIFVDNYECIKERNISTILFGKPLNILKRQCGSCLNKIEQAHFIANSKNVLQQYSMYFVNVNKTKQPKKMIRQFSKNDVSTKWTILVTVNDGFFDFFKNWILYYKKLNISHKLYVIAEDGVVYRKLIDLNERLIVVQRSKYISINGSVNYGSHLYKKLVSVRPLYILSFLLKNINILYSDVDTVWLKNPFPYLKGNFDIWGQMDVQERNIFCTGFIAILSNIKTVAFVEKWYKALHTSIAHNQPIFNVLLKQTSLRTKPLNSTLFPSGKQYFRQFSEEERSKAVVVHNNWIIGHDRKLERFKNMSLWLMIAK